MIKNKNNQYIVECLSKIAGDCLQNGEYCDSEEEAENWVEKECWIFSGEGWICIKCHEQFMGNLKSHRKEQGNGLDGIDSDVKGHDGLDNDLETGIGNVYGKVN